MAFRFVGTQKGEGAGLCVGGGGGKGVVLFDRGSPFIPPFLSPLLKMSKSTQNSSLPIHRHVPTASRSPLVSCVCVCVKLLRWMGNTNTIQNSKKKPPSPFCQTPKTSPATPFPLPPSSHPPPPTPSFTPFQRGRKRGKEEDDGTGGGGGGKRDQGTQKRTAPPISHLPPRLLIRMV